MSFHAPNKYRLRTHPTLGSLDTLGNNGFFIIPHYKIADYELRCQVSDGEEWKPIKEYEELYQVSNSGKIKALEKYINLANGGYRRNEIKLLEFDSSGRYLRVKLCSDGEEKSKLVHVIVAEHFIDNPNNYQVVNHIDGDKYNNHVTNLEWCTEEYNQHHAIENGFRSGITKSDIEYIKNLLETGTPIKDIADLFNKKRQTISDIKFGRHRNLNPSEPSKYTGLNVFWEHVSISVGPKRLEPKRCPTWLEMCYIKDIFWDNNDTVIQYHPAAENYVNCHKFVLHLWRPINVNLPLPDPILVGLKTIEHGRRS